MRKINTKIIGLISSVFLMVSCSKKDSLSPITPVEDEIYLVSKISSEFPQNQYYNEYGEYFYNDDGSIKSIRMSDCWGDYVISVAYGENSIKVEDCCHDLVYIKSLAEGKISCSYSNSRTEEYYRYSYDPLQKLTSFENKSHLIRFYYDDSAKIREIYSEWIDGPYKGLTSWSSKEFTYKLTNNLLPEIDIFFLLPYGGSLSDFFKSFWHRFLCGETIKNQIGKLVISSYYFTYPGAVDGDAKSTSEEADEYNYKYEYDVRKLPVRIEIMHDGEIWKVLTITYQMAPEKKTP
jgi:hypothetical protein